MNKEELLRYAKSEANRLLENVGEALMPSPEAIDDGAHGFVNYYPLKILAPVAGSKGLEIAAQYNDGRTMGLYIHTPLCYSKCTFCSYVSLPYSQEIADRYFAALEKEIIIAGNLYKRNTVSSVYFGGGTSTIWPVERLEKLFTLIDENFYLLRRGSICFEANPKVFAESKKANDRKFERLAELGVDRISIGIQSFNHGLLKKVGRGYYHKEDILSSLDLAKQLFKNVNIDLMHSLPGQTLEDVLSDLDEIEKLAVNDLKPNQITWYQTRVSPHCRIFDDFSKNFSTIGALTSKILIAKGLKELGFKQVYENRFSLDGKVDEFKKIRGQGNLLGLGVSPYSHFTHSRDLPFLELVARNTVSIEEYVEKIGDGKLPIVAARKFNRDEAIISHFINCLGKGSDLEEAVLNKSRFHTTLAGHLSPFSFESYANSLYYLSAVNLLERAGLIETTDKNGKINSIKLTQDGQYLSTEITQLLYSSLTKTRIHESPLMAKLVEISNFMCRFVPH